MNEGVGGRWIHMHGSVDGWIGEWVDERIDGWLVE